MKRIFTLLLLAVCCTMYAQTSGEIKIGDELKLGEPSTSNYEHVDFPRKNFIIKRNGIANMKKMAGTAVTVVEKVQVNGNLTKISIARKDGKRFFGMKRYVMVSLEDALASGELVL